MFDPQEEASLEDFDLEDDEIEEDFTYSIDDPTYFSRRTF